MNRFAELLQERHPLLFFPVHPNGHFGFPNCASVGQYVGYVDVNAFCDFGRCRKDDPNDWIRLTHFLPGGRFKVKSNLNCIVLTINHQRDLLYYAVLSNNITIPCGLQTNSRANIKRKVKVKRYKNSDFSLFIECLKGFRRWLLSLTAINHISRKPKCSAPSPQAFFVIRPTSAVL